MASALAAAASAFVASQTPTRIAPGNASISGRVIDRQTKRPVANVTMTLTAPSKLSAPGKLSEGVLVTSTNAAGEYSFESIAAGHYQVKATHPEYVDAVLGPDDTMIGGVLIRLGEKQRSTNHDLALMRGGSISGTVTGVDGRPLNDATVRLIPLAPSNAAAFFGLGARTNERGQYTIVKVPEGRFHVQAAWSDKEATAAGIPVNLGLVYFPGSKSLAEAVPVDVGPAADVRHIDLAMILDPLLRLSGHVLRHSSAGPIEGQLRGAGGIVRTFRIGEDDAFDLRLKAGRYVLLARAEADDGAETGSLSVDLTTDATGLLLTLAKAGRISGRVVTDDGSPIVDRLFVLAVLSDGAREIDLERKDRVEVSSSGVFELTGIAGERVLRVIGLSENWTVYQVLVGKTPVSSVSLDAGSVDDVTILLKRQ
jgi:hypothetical protein